MSKRDHDVSVSFFIYSKSSTFGLVVTIDSHILKRYNDEVALYENIRSRVER